jgi:E3 ubiquitin ligase
MAGFGGLLLAIGFIAAIYWFIMARKAGKIKSVPFRKPSEIAAQGPASADAKGQVSCEGQVQGQPLIAPASGQPCLYWEFELVRQWEKYSTDSNGNRTTSSGSTSVNTEKLGTVFTLTDGTGGVAIDCTKKPDSDLKTSHSSEIRIGMLLPGELMFGNLRTQVPHLPGGENVKGFKGVEKIVPFQAGQTLFALGKLSQGQYGPTLGDMGWSSLMLSDKGREATLGSAVKGAKIGMITTIASGAIGAILLTIGLLTASPTPAAATAAPDSSAMAPGDSSAAAPTTTTVTTGATVKPTLPGVKPTVATSAKAATSGAAATPTATATTTAAAAATTAKPAVAAPTIKPTIVVPPKKK